MDPADVAWSFGQDPDLIVEVWSTAALVEAVLAALLDDPAAMAKAVAVLRGSRDSSA